MHWPRSGPEAARMRLEVERLIEASGDGRAIRRLGELRRDPVRWPQMLLRLAAESPVLKIALGVFLGIIAADAVRHLMQGDTLQTLGQGVDQAIAEAGGPEALLAAASLPTDVPTRVFEIDTMRSATGAATAQAMDDRSDAGPDDEGSELGGGEDDGGDLDFELDLPF